MEEESKQAPAQDCRYLAEVSCTQEEAVTAHRKINNQKLKNCCLRLIPQEFMKQIVITNLPDVFSHKDLFLILNSMTPGIKRIIVPDNPNPTLPGETMNIAIAIYENFQMAQEALKVL